MEISTEPAVQHRAPQRYAHVESDQVWMGHFEVIADRFGEVFGWLAERGVAPSGPAVFVYRRIVMPGPMVVRAAVPIEDEIDGDERVAVDVLPGGDHVVQRVVGHPDTLEAATGDLLAWADQQGLEFDQWDAPDGHAWASRSEWYWSDPAEDPMDQWVTDLVFKLR